MAYPLARYYDFVDDSTPEVDAGFLNAIQDADIGIYTGSQTVKAVYADGTGAQGSSANPGDLKGQRVVVTESKSGTTAPTSTVALGTQEKDGTLIGWAVCTIDGSHHTVLVRGYNVKSVGQNGANGGPYYVTFNVAPANPTQACIMATALSAGGASQDASALAAVGVAGVGGDAGLLVAHITTDGAHGDVAFMVVAFSG